MPKASRPSNKSLPSFVSYSEIKEMVEQFTGQPFLKHCTIARLVKKGAFPQPCKVSARSLFKVEDVLAWLKGRGISLPVDAE